MQALSSYKAGCGIVVLFTEDLGFKGGIFDFCSLFDGQIRKSKLNARDELVGKTENKDVICRGEGRLSESGNGDGVFSGTRRERGRSAAAQFGKCVTELGMSETDGLCNRRCSKTRDEIMERFLPELLFCWHLTLNRLKQTKLNKKIKTVSTVLPNRLFFLIFWSDFLNKTDKTLLEFLKFIYLYLIEFGRLTVCTCVLDLLEKERNPLVSNSDLVGFSARDTERM